MPIMLAGASRAIVVVLVIAITGFTAPPTIIAIITLATELTATCTRAFARRAARAAEPTAFATFAVAWWRRTIGATRATSCPATTAFFAAATWAFTVARRTWAIAIAHPWTFLGTALGEHVILGSTPAEPATFPRRSWRTTTVGKGRVWPVFADELG